LETIQPSVDCRFNWIDWRINVKDKQQILTALREEFRGWQEVLAGMSEEEITTPHLPAGLSVKDVIAHLRAWQQLSIARLEAALRNGEPALPGWPPGPDPESAEGVEQINAWIYERYHKQPWPAVQRNWRQGFRRFLELAEAIPEKELLEPGRYTWLGTYPLLAVLVGSHEHHLEHRDELLAWLRQQGRTGSAG
jgi:hypothetical protein